MELWTEKYRPKVGTEIVGHTDIIASFKYWLQNWKELKGGYFLWGNPGLGKTTIVLAVCKELGYKCLEFNASDIRSSKEIKKIKQQTTNTHSVESFFTGSKPEPIAILLDEVDGIYSGETLTEVLSWVEDKSRLVPIIFTANDTIVSLRKITEGQMVLPPPIPSIVDYLSDIAKKEKVKIKKDILVEIVKASNSDIRQSINMLQFGHRSVVNTTLKQIDKFTNLIAGNFYNIDELISWNHVIFGCLLHSSCPDDLLFSFMNPVVIPQSVEDMIKPYKEFKGYSDMKMSKYSILSQWSLYKQNRK